MIGRIAPFQNIQWNARKTFRDSPSDEGAKESPWNSDAAASPSNSGANKSSSDSYAQNLQEASANSDPKFMPIIRGDEAELDSQINDQASFGRAVDQVAQEYGQDPNLLRAQLEAESSAFSKGYQQAMQHEGDVDRASENNSSIGLGQISRKFLDGREWSDGGPNNPRVGGQTVTTEQYLNSPTIQLRIAASNLGMRQVDHGQGNLEPGLRYYVSGHVTRDEKNSKYLENIEAAMQNTEYMTIGR